MLRIKKFFSQLIVLNLKLLEFILLLKWLESLLQADVSQLRIRIKALQETVEMLRARNVQLLAEKNEGCTRMRISDSHDQQVCIGKRLRKHTFE